ncbi:MAG: PAS domain S-box protein [Methanohalobium sp.]|uniref:PAS domain S-box protein n=1 Tax=Methanohalobium sp. TaxID=2837493 RepID=UPI00397B60CF
MRKRYNNHLKPSNAYTEYYITDKLNLTQTIASITNVFGYFSDIDAKIQDSLGKIGDLFNSTRSYVFLFRNNGKMMDNTHEWCYVGVGSRKGHLQNLSTDIFPWLMNELKKDDIIYVSDVASLPDEALKEKNTLGMGDSRSFIIIPMHIRDELAGFIGMDNVIVGHKVDNLNILQMVSDVIGTEIEQKLADKSLEESEKLHRRLIENLPVGVLTTNNEGKIIQCNRYLETIIGSPKEEITGLNLLILPIKNELKDCIRTALDGYTQNYEGEYTAILSDRNIWIKACFTPDISEDGKIVGCVGTIEDLTGKISEPPSEETSLMEKLMDNISSHIWYLTNSETYGLVNEPHASFFECKKEDLSHKNLYQVHEEKTAGLMVSLNNYVFENKTRLQTTEKLVNKRGELRTLSIILTPELDSNGDVRYVICSAEDITEYEKTKDNIQKSEIKYRTLFNDSTDAIFVQDLNDNFLDVNLTACEFLGYSKSEILKMSYKDIDALNQVEKLDGFKRELYRHGHAIFETVHLKKDGTTVNVEVNSRLIPYNDMPAILLVVRDITGRKKSEEKLQKYAEELEHSNKLKDMFTDILRHDLLNPAGVVKGFTQLLLSMEDDEYKTDVLYKIRDNNENLIGMIENAAYFAKLGSTDELEFEVQDIAAILNDVISDFEQQAKDNDIDIEFLPEGKYPAGVNIVIEQAFSNLLSNAIKYSPEGEKVIIDINDVENYWKVTVTDFGEGVPDKDKDTIFTRFQRIEKGGVKGSGLGLAIVKRIIELHGGEVGVDDNPEGQGSVFWVTVIKAEY